MSTGNQKQTILKEDAMETQFNQMLESLRSRGMDTMADRLRRMYDDPIFPFLDDLERKIFLNEMEKSII